MNPERENPTTGEESVALQELRRETARTIAERTPFALAVLGGCLLIINLLEVVSPIQRSTPSARDHLATLAWFDIGFALLALLVDRAVRARPERSASVLAAGAFAVAAGFNVYHWLIDARLEIGVLAVSLFVSLTAVLMPWDWKRQGTACLGALLTFPLAAATQAPAAIPLSYSVLALLAASAFSVLGAAARERHRAADFHLRRALTERETRLLKAMELAEQANRAKGEFLATMSHELRTPINVIFGMTDMALDTALSAEQRDYVRRTRASAGTLLVLVNDVLDFTRLEAGRFQLVPRPFALRRWLAETVEPLQMLAARKSLELRAVVDDSIPDALVADAPRLAQVLVNLVTNAIKFTARGRIEVEFSSAPWPGPSPARALHLRFAVRDTGVGIASADRDRIFEAFTQGPDSSAPGRSGTGLGLAICQRLLEMMDGGIRVESEPGQGSCFHCTAVVEIATLREDLGQERAEDASSTRG